MSLYVSGERLAQAVQRLGASDVHSGLCDYLIVARALKLSDGQPVAVSKKSAAVVRAINEYMATVESHPEEPLDGDWENFNVFGWSRDKTKGYRKSYYKNGLNTTVKSWSMLRREGKNPTHVDFSPELIERRDSVTPDWSDWKASVGQQPYDPALITGPSRPYVGDVAVWFFRHYDLEEPLGDVSDEAAATAELIEMYKSESGLAPADLDWLFSETDAAEEPEEAQHLSGDDDS